MRNFGNCETLRKDSKIVLTDSGSKNKRSKFCLENPSKSKIRVIQVDDCVIKQGVRCDYLVILPSKSTSYSEQEIYIELKGSDVKHAVEQIATSIKKLTDDISALKLGFIATTRCPLNSPEIQKLKKTFKRKYNVKLIIKNRERNYTQSLVFRNYIVLKSDRPT